MKLHIENLNVTITHQPPVGLIAGMALASAAKFAAPSSIPDIGDNVARAGAPILEAGDSLVHLILWDTDPKERMKHEAAVKFAEAVNPDMAPDDSPQDVLRSNPEGQINRFC